MANNIIRSFRYDAHIESILLKFKGENLNQKFVNMVSYCFDEEKALTKRITQKQKDLQELEAKLTAKRKELYALDDVIRSGKDLQSALRQIAIKACDFNSKL